MTEVRKPVVAVTYGADELRDFIHWKWMFEGIVAAGAVPLAIDCSSPVPHLRQLLELADGLVVSGGVDVDPRVYGGASEDELLGPVHPQRDENEIRALEIAAELGRPVLAICRGAQLANVVAGGRMLMDVRRDLGGIVVHQPGEEVLDHATHGVVVESGSRLAELLGVEGRIQVNSQHHQGIAAVGDGARVVARSDDGLIEGFELESGLLVAVQWHPEVLWTEQPHALALLTNFAAEALGRSARGAR